MGGEASINSAGRGYARSEKKRERIVDAVITVLSEAGIARLTHRRVAAAANVSLSATTYHYATKADMLADASRKLLDGYLRTFRQIVHQQQCGRRETSVPPAACARRRRDGGAARCSSQYHSDVREGRADPRGEDWSVLEVSRKRSCRVDS